MFNMNKKGSSIMSALILGFVALYVGSMLVPQIWDTIIGNPVVSTNSTTKTFLEMVPWMAAIGLVISAVTVFVVGARKRL